MRRRTLISGTAAGVLTVSGVAVTRACADPQARDASLAGATPVMKFDPATGRWPARPDTGSSGVIWLDAAGGAPKPPLATGDLYLKAVSGSASATAMVAGEKLLASMRKFGIPWEVRGGARLMSDGGAQLAAAGDAVTLPLVPVTPGEKFNFTTMLTSGGCVATVQFWDKSTQILDISDRGTGSSVTVSGTVPAGASAANLWLEYYKAPASFTSTSFVENS